MASEQIIADLNKSETFYDNNFDIWHHKIQYMLEEQEALELLASVMAQHEEDDRSESALHDGVLVNFGLCHDLYYVQVFMQVFMDLLKWSPENQALRSFVKLEL